MTVLSNIITPSNVLTTTNTATVTNKTLTSPTVTGMVVSDGTANGVTYLNGSKVLTSGSALTFDGTNMAVGTTPTSFGAGYSVLTVQGSTTGFVQASNGTIVTEVGTFGSIGYTGTRSNHSYGFVVNGSEQMRLTSTGLGIGTSSPSYKLSVNGNAGFTGNYISLNDYSYIRTDVAGWFTMQAGSNGYQWRDSANGATAQMVLNSSGNLGLGVTPSAKLDVNGVICALGGNSPTGGFNLRNVAGTITPRMTNDAGDGTVIRPGASGGSVKFNNFANSAELAQITDAGNLLVGVTSTSDSNVIATSLANKWALTLIHSNASTPNGYYVYYTGASPNNTARDFFYATDSTAQRMSVRSNGGIANYSANDVNLSDRREKTNFAPATSYLDKICAIPVQTFNYIDQNLEEDGGLTLGVVAQDVQAVAPELVMESNWASKDETPKMRLSIYQTDLQYALMKALQELNAKFDAYVASHP